MIIAHARSRLGRLWSLIHSRVDASVQENNVGGALDGNSEGSWVLVGGWRVLIEGQLVDPNQLKKDLVRLLMFGLKRGCLL